MDRTNIIYEIPCDGNRNESCSLSYVGQTRNQLRKRLAQHRSNINCGRNPNGQSAVVTHFTEKGHFPAFDKTKALATEKYLGRRNTRESLHIYSSDTYNLRRDTDRMAASYCALLDQRRKTRNTRLHDTHAPTTNTDLASNTTVT